MRPLYYLVYFRLIQPLEVRPQVMLPTVLVSKTWTFTPFFKYATTFAPVLAEARTFRQSAVTVRVFPVFTGAWVWLWPGAVLPSKVT